MTVNRTIRVTKTIPCEIISVKHYGPVTNKRLMELPCTACKEPLGDRPWGIAWRKGEKGNVAMRLCESCIKQADPDDSTIGKKVGQ